MFWVLFASSDESACVVLKALIKQAEGTQSVKEEAAAPPDAASPSSPGIFALFVSLM